MPDPNELRGIADGMEDQGFGSAAAVVASAADQIEEQQAEIDRLRAALTPSAETKAAYIGEFSVPFPTLDMDGNECLHQVNVPWTTIKKIMAAIQEYATTTRGSDG